MKITYKQADTSVNVSKVSPLKRALQLFMGLMVTLVFFYVALGLLVNIMARHIPMSVEYRLGHAIIGGFDRVENSEQEAYYQSILEKIAGADIANTYRVMIIEQEDINAFAIPGNIIAFTSAYVDSIDDEEIIAFTLGHELGHFQNRDHVKGYGRGLLLYSMAEMVTGSDNSLSIALLDVLKKTEMKFSQKDELRADAYGAKLIYQQYGRYDGGIAFFETIKTIEEVAERSELASYFDSHPHPDIRIKAIEAMIDH